MKPQLLETTRLFLAIERAADLGDEGIALSELAHDFGLSEIALKGFLQTVDSSFDAAASPDELIDWELDDSGKLTVFYAAGLDQELPLGADEASALLIGLDRLGVAPRRLAHLQRALRLRLSNSEAERLATLRGRLAVRAEHRWRAQIESAIEEGLGLRILYESENGRGWRRVQPSALVDHQGQMYLGAWCFERQAPRLFRSDRIEDLQSWQLEESTGKAPDRAGLLRRLAKLSDGHLAERLVLRLHDEDADWMLRDYFGADIRIVDGCFTTHEFAGQALANWIVGCAGSVLVESPVELAELVRNRAELMSETLLGV